jgi:excisionase family DNA binding protein
LTTTDDTRPEIQTNAAMVSANWVAKTLGCSVRHVLRMADGGLMPAPAKLGRLSRWNRKELEKWIADGCPAVRRSRQ